MYRGLDLEGGRLVAMKVATTADNHSVAKEVKMLRHLAPTMAKSEYFLTTYRLGEDEFVCSLAAHGSVDHCLAEGLTFPLPFLAGIAEDMSRALEAVHGANVLHRDVKPANVLLERDGSTKLADFSLAVIGDSSDAYVGTFAYLAPERLRGLSYGRPADVWALAMTLVNLALDGDHANRFDTDASFWPALDLYEKPNLLENIIAHAAEDDIHLVDDDDDFRSFIASRLDPDPSQRPTTLDDDHSAWLQRRWSPAECRAHLAPLVPPMAARLKDLTAVLDHVPDDSLFVVGSAQLENLADDFDLPVSTVRSALRARPDAVRLLRRPRGLPRCFCS